MSYLMLVTSQLTSQTTKISTVFWRALVRPHFEKGSSTSSSRSRRSSTVLRRGIHDWQKAE